MPSNAQNDTVTYLKAEGFIEVPTLPFEKKTFHVSMSSVYAINLFGECVQMHFDGDSMTAVKSGPGRTLPAEQPEVPWSEEIKVGGDHEKFVHSSILNGR